MRLSIAVIAMSNLPSMRLVSWNTELGVGVIFTSRPFLARRAEGAVGAGGTPAHDARSDASTPAISLLRMVSSFSWFLPVRSELQARLRVRSRHGLQRRLFYSFVFPVFAKLRDVGARAPHAERFRRERDRKSTRLNSSHRTISY